jgi:hypothetical protein
VAVREPRADSGRPLESLRGNLLEINSALFIGQSSRSNYCGVYSTGMLLSLLGFLTTRHQALALFNLKRSNPDYPGASHITIGNMFATVTKVKRWRWEFHSQFDLAFVSRSLREHLRISACPTLLSFGAIHKNGEWRCTHVAVVIGATKDMIELLDPLGSRPLMNNRANVGLWAAEWPRSVRVIGGSYQVDHESEAAVLRWPQRRQHA